MGNFGSIYDPNVTLKYSECTCLIFLFLIVFPIFRVELCSLLCGVHDRNYW